MRFPKSFVTGGRLASMRSLTGGDLRILLVLITHADESGVVSASQHALVDLSGLSRAAVQQALARLGRHSLIAYESHRGKRAEYRVTIDNMTTTPVKNLTNSPVKSPLDDRPNLTTTPVTYEENMTTTPVKSEPNMTSSPVNFPKQAHARALNVTTQRHQYDANARSALTTLRRERKLPLSVDELVKHAYRLGEGDPWDGYQGIKQHTDAAITGAQNPAAVLRARLKEAAA